MMGPAGAVVAVVIEYGTVFDTPVGGSEDTEGREIGVEHEIGVGSGLESEVGTESTAEPLAEHEPASEHETEPAPESEPEPGIGIVLEPVSEVVGVVAIFEAEDAGSEPARATVLVAEPGAFAVAE
jgi:hypothetical protein